MTRPSRISLSNAAHAPHALPTAELWLALVIALAYVGLSAYFVLEWAGMTASFGALSPSGLEN